MPTWSSQLDICLQTANVTTVPIIVYHRCLCRAIISERIEYNSLPLHKVFHWDIVTFSYALSEVKTGSTPAWSPPRTTRRPQSCTSNRESSSRTSSAGTSTRSPSARKSTRSPSARKSTRSPSARKSTRTSSSRTTLSPSSVGSPTRKSLAGTITSSLLLRKSSRTPLSRVAPRSSPVRLSPRVSSAGSSSLRPSSLKHCAWTRSRVQPEPDYPAGNRNGTGIPVPVSRNQNGFLEFRFRLIRTGCDV
jgi:hypothetical protein